MAASGLDASNINAKDPKTGQYLYTQRVRDAFNSPQIQQALQLSLTGAPQHVKLDDGSDTNYIIENGKIVKMATGGIWKPLLTAAAIAGTAGIASSALAPTATISTLGPSTGANMAATTAASTSVPSSLAATSSTSGMLGLTSGELARYGLGQAGSVINNIMQSRAQGQQFDQQQAFLREALAYQKEQDAYNRQRQTGLDAQDTGRYAYETGQSASRYGDTQQQYLSEFARNEDRYGYATDLEASRYMDTSKRIAPYLQSGANANDRMAKLLGLPAGAPFDPTLTAPPKRTVSAPPVLSNPGSGYGGPAPSQRVSSDPATDAAIRAALQANNSSDDFSYWQDKLAAHGDSASKNWKYWSDFIARGDGVGKGYKGAA